MDVTRHHFRGPPRQNRGEVAMLRGDGPDEQPRRGKSLAAVVSPNMPGGPAFDETMLYAATSGSGLEGPTRHSPGLGEERPCATRNRSPLTQ
jgi:hypothetical protein